jgi:hypothetical protein
VFAARGQFRVRALGSLAGTWNDIESPDALIRAGLPTLMIAGTSDLGVTVVTALKDIWPSLALPKHRAAVRGLGHWDWFGSSRGIHPCDASEIEPPACPLGWQIASELLLGFFTRHLKNDWQLPPYLLGDSGEMPPGGRPPLRPYFEASAPWRCAVQVGWEDPIVASPHATAGERTFGTWDTPEKPW